MMIVPVRATTRMIVVLTKPWSMPPRVKAVTKLSRFVQLDGGSSGPVSRNSACVLNDAMKIVTSGTTATRHATTSDTYLRVVPTGPRTGLAPRVQRAQPARTRSVADGAGSDGAAASRGPGVVRGAGASSVRETPSCAADVRSGAALIRGHLSRRGRRVAAPTR